MLGVIEIGMWPKLAGLLGNLFIEKLSVFALHICRKDSLVGTLRLPAFKQFFSKSTIFSSCPFVSISEVQNLICLFGDNYGR